MLCILGHTNRIVCTSWTNDANINYPVVIVVYPINVLMYKP